METEDKYLDVKPDQISAAETLCGDLNKKGTSQYQLLEKVMPKMGAIQCVFSVRTLGQNEAAMVVKIHAESVQKAITTFQRTSDPEAVELRNLIDAVLTIPIEKNPCPVLKSR